MAETVKVMIPEEQVEERIKQLGEQQRLRRKADSFDLCIKGRRIFYVRIGKENFRSGIYGLYECQQLR